MWPSRDEDLYFSNFIVSHQAYKLLSEKNKADVNEILEDEGKRK